MLSRKPDGVWAWLVLLAATLCQTIIGGTCLTGGVMYVIFHDSLSSNPVTLSWLCALPVSTWFFGTPIGSFLTNRYGCRTCAMIGGIVTSFGFSIGFFANDVTVLFFSYGILPGIGSGISYTACMVAINQYFHKFKTLAAGLSSIGNNVGFIFYSKLIIQLDYQYTRNGILLILGAISFHMCAFGACMAPVEHVEERQYIAKDTKEATVKYDPVKVIHLGNDWNEEHESNDHSNPEMYTKSVIKVPLDKTNCSNKCQKKKERRKLINLSLFKNSPFLLFCVGNVLSSISFGIYLLHLPSFCKDHNFTYNDIASVMTVYGIANIIGKIVFSILGQHPRINNTLVYTISIAISGACIGLTPVFRSRIAMFILPGIIGFFFCVTAALLQVVIYNIVGYDRFSDGIGLSMPFKATGNLIGGPLAGFILETSGKYDTSFYLCACCIALAALCLTPAIFNEHGQNREHEAESQRAVVTSLVDPDDKTIQ